MNKVYGDAPAVAHPHFDSLYFFSAQFRLKLFRSLSTCPRCPWISHRPSAASSAPIFLFSIRFALLIVSVYIVKQKTQRVQYFFAAAAPAASGVRRAKIRTKDKKGDGFSRNRLLHFAVFSLFPQNNSHRENLSLGELRRATGSLEAVLAYSLAPVFLDFMGFLASALKCCPSI